MRLLSDVGTAGLYVSRRKLHTAHVPDGRAARMIGTLHRVESTPGGLDGLREQASDYSCLVINGPRVAETWRRLALQTVDLSHRLMPRGAPSYWRT